MVESTTTSRGPGHQPKQVQEYRSTERRLRGFSAYSSGISDAATERLPDGSFARPGLFAFDTAGNREDTVIS